MFEFEKPKIEILDVSEDNKYARFVCQPLERGYGITLGNSLRRIMLSSLPGAAVSQIKIRFHIGDRRRRGDCRIVPDQFAGDRKTDREGTQCDQSQIRKNRPALAGGTVCLSGRSFEDGFQIVISSFSLSAASLSRFSE